MGTKRLHPERILMMLLGILVPTIWIFALAGFFTGNRRFHYWALFALIVTLIVAFMPLLAFLIGLVIENFRNNRHD